MIMQIMVFEEAQLKTYKISLYRYRYIYTYTYKYIFLKIKYTDKKRVIQ